MFKANFFRSEISDRARQFGFRAGATQLFRAMVRRIYQTNEDIIFVIPHFSGHRFSDPIIKTFTVEHIKFFGAKGILSEKQVNLFCSFIAEGSKGLFAEIDGQLAAYGWVQFKGEYKFGKTGRMIIPPNYAIPKNLFVFAEYRGHKLGHKLNQARLQIIPSNATPLAFIIPENRFAIRNWEQFGFKRILYIRRWRWLCFNWNMTINRLTSGPHSDVLEQALIQGHSGNKYGLLRDKSN